MNKNLVRQLALVAALSPLAASVNAALYGTIGDGEGTGSILVELDSSTGQVSQNIGSVGYIVNGLTWDASTSTMYATTSNYNESHPDGLITINLTTGAGTPVGTGAGQYVNVVTANSTGGLYGWTEETDDAVVWNKTAGTITVLDDSDLGTWQQSLAFDNNDVLYLLNGNEHLYRVNTTTGAVEDLGAIVAGDYDMDVAHHGDFNPADNHLYAISATGTSNPRGIWIIDITTMEVVGYLDTEDGLHTLAFAGVSLPTPLLSGGTTLTSLNGLSTIGRIIQARQDANKGMNSGDEFLGDRKFWLKPFGAWADQGDRGGVSGFDADTKGVLLGADGNYNNNTRVGVAFAYAQSDVDGNSATAPQSADISIYHLIGYGSYNLSADTELNFQLGVGRNQNKGQRILASSVASSKFNSTAAQLGVGVSRKYALGEKTSIIPSVRADYTWIRDGSYTETGAGSQNLTVDNLTAKQFVVGLEGKLHHAINNNTSVTANLGVGYDFIGDDNSVTAAFASNPATSYVIPGLEPSRWIRTAGVGLVHNLPSGTEITARFDYEGRSDFSNKTASIKGRWAF